MLVAVYIEISVTFVEPSVLEAIEGIEKRHVQETDELSDHFYGKETDKHALQRDRRPSSAQTYYNQ